MQLQRKSGDRRRGYVSLLLRDLLCSFPAVAEDAVSAILVAVVVWLAVVVVPRAAVAYREQEIRLAQDVAVTNHAYCVRWGLPAGGESHATCVLDLGRIRDAERMHALAHIHSLN